MALHGRDHFDRAYALVRRRVGSLHYVPGAPIAVGDIAEVLGVSHTPVREALAHLAGERLIDERRGHGFFAPGLTANDIGELYSMRALYLDVALKMSADLARLPDWSRAEQALARSAEPVVVMLSRDVFGPLIAARGSLLLLEAAGGIAARLVPVERAEPAALPEAHVEVAQLLSAGRSGDPAALRRQLKQYHRRRTAAAVALAGILRTPVHYTIDID